MLIKKIKKIKLRGVWRKYGPPKVLTEVSEGSCRFMKVCEGYKGLQGAKRVKNKKPRGGLP